MSIAIVGEAWGVEEERERTPFVGASGYELTRMLDEAGIKRADCLLTNVFSQHPPGNDLTAFTGGKAVGLVGYPALGKSHYIRAEFAHELIRLGDELLDFNPNVVVALGNTALWALCGKTAISKSRGTTMVSTHTVSGFKVLPTYHPAAVIRQWDLRAIVIADLHKALRESAYPEIRRPKRTIHIPETLEDIHEYKARHIDGCRDLAVDIETAGNQVTCIGFAPSKDSALVVPIHDPTGVGRSYWHPRSLEVAIWGVIRAILNDPFTRKIFQNGLYDIAFLWRSVRIAVMNAAEDTMLLHHALYPELQKSLGFMGSIYTDEGAWKQMRTRNTTIKGDA